MGSLDMARGHREKVAISAHQGGPSGSKVIDIATYDAAANAGVEYVELDIRTTHDQEFVVFHDEHVGRGGPLIGSVSYEELCAIAQAEVPRVVEVLKLLKGKAIAHLDLKEIGNEESVVKLAVEIVGERNMIVTSLEDESIAAVRKAFPDVRTALSLGRDMAGKGRIETFRTRLSELFPLRRVAACGAHWVASNHKLACLTVLRVCAAKNIGVMVWTVNDEVHMSRYLNDPRVAVLITDFPVRAAEIRNGRAPRRVP